MNVKASPRVQAICREERISEDELARMIRLSAPYSGDGGNRRFHSWVFDIRNDTCENMRIDQLLTVGRLSPNGWVVEEHSGCDGQGCKACGWAGQVVRYL